MQTTIQKWGNSHAVRLPKTILEALSLAENDPVSITADNDKITIVKASRKRYAKKSIDQCLEEFYGKPIDVILTEDTLYTPVETNWGKPLGNEVW